VNQGATYDQPTFFKDRRRSLVIHQKIVDVFWRSGQLRILCHHYVAQKCQEVRPAKTASIPVEGCFQDILDELNGTTDILSVAPCHRRTRCPSYCTSLVNSYLPLALKEWSQIRPDLRILCPLVGIASTGPAEDAEWQAEPE
jgi:hypothetical protein